MTNDYQTQEVKKRHKYLVTCRLCHYTLSEEVQTPQDMWEHDRIWHQKGNILYFLVHKKAEYKY